MQGSASVFSWFRLPVRSTPCESISVRTRSSMCPFSSSRQLAYPQTLNQPSRKLRWDWRFLHVLPHKECMTLVLPHWILIVCMVFLLVGGRTKDPKCTSAAEDEARCFVRLRPFDLKTSELCIAFFVIFVTWGTPAIDHSCHALARQTRKSDLFPCVQDCRVLQLH